jgi:hypothetical protein
LITNKATYAFWVGETREQIIAGNLIAMLKNYYYDYDNANFNELPSITNTQFILS